MSIDILGQEALVWLKIVQSPSVVSQCIYQRLFSRKYSTKPLQWPGGLALIRPVLML